VPNIQLPRHQCSASRRNNPTQPFRIPNRQHCQCPTVGRSSSNFDLLPVLAHYYVYIYICIHVYIIIHINVYIYACVLYIYICIYTYMHKYRCTWTCICTCIHINHYGRIGLGFRLRVCVYIYICIHTLVYGLGCEK